MNKRKPKRRGKRKVKIRKLVFGTMSKKHPWRAHRTEMMNGVMVYSDTKIPVHNCRFVTDNLKGGTK